MAALTKSKTITHTVRK